MASSLQRDTHHLRRRTGRPPIVLARLPRLGSSAQVQPTPQTDQSAPVAESLPQLELRDQINQRIRLHVADAPTDDLPSTSHFADHQHAVDRGHIHLQTEQPRVGQAEIAQVPAPKLRSADSGPTTLSEKIFQLHAQLSPHAGLIVALALIASAGLLYWMIVGPAPLPAPNYENFAPELHDQGIGSSTDYMPDFSAAASQPTPANEAANQWMKVTLPEPASAVEEVAVEEASLQVAQTEIKPAAPELLPSAEQIDYPMTSHAAFDLRKTGDSSRMGMGQPTSEALTSLPVVAGPEVAGRPSSTITR